MASKKKGATTADARVRSFLIRDLRKAREVLKNDTLDSQSAIHLARRRLKSIRAILELLCKETPYPYRVKKKTARNISKTLAWYRDADAMIETLERIQDRYSERLPRHVYDALWQSFARHRTATIDSRGDVDNDIMSARIALARAARRVQLMPLDGVSEDTLLAARNRTERRMHKARKKALDSHAPEVFHRWRQRVKTLLYQEQLLRKLVHGNKKTRRHLKTVAEVLGHANDAAMLNDYLDYQPDALKIDQNIRILRALAQDQQSILHQKAHAQRANP